MIHPSFPATGGLYITRRYAMLRSLFFQELLAMKAQKDNEESAPLPNGIRDHKGFTKA